MVIIIISSSSSSGGGGGGSSIIIIIVIIIIIIISITMSIIIIIVSCPSVASRRALCQALSQAPPGSVGCETAHRARYNMIKHCNIA